MQSPIFVGEKQSHCKENTNQSIIHREVSKPIKEKIWIVSYFRVVGSPVANDKSRWWRACLIEMPCMKPGRSKTFKKLVWCSENDTCGMYKTETIVITEPIYFLLKWETKKTIRDRLKFNKRWNLERETELISSLSSPFRIFYQPNIPSYRGKNAESPVSMEKIWAASLQPESQKKTKTHFCH